MESERLEKLGGGEVVLNEDNIKMDLKWIKWEDFDWTHLA